MYSFERLDQNKKKQAGRYTQRDRGRQRHKEKHTDMYGVRKPERASGTHTEIEARELERYMTGYNYPITKDFTDQFQSCRRIHRCLCPSLLLAMVHITIQMYSLYMSSPHTSGSKRFCWVSLPGIPKGEKCLSDYVTGIILTPLLLLS